MKRLSVIILALLALAMPARAQSTWATPQTASGGPTVTGGVGLCLNSSGYAVPCASSPGGATSGATGSLVFGSVTTSAPTYANGTVNALSLDTSGNLRVSATVNASVSGFAPGGVYATATAPSGSSSAATLLPAGTTVVFFNTGSNPVSVNLGGSGVAAVATDNIVAAGGALPLTIGSNTYFAVWGVGGASTVVASGGTGLATGWGGGLGSASTPMSSAVAFPATNTPVTGTFSATGVSASFTPSSPAAFNIFLGVGVGAVHLEKRIAGTGTWSIIEAAGMQLYTWTTFTAAFVEQMSEEQGGIEYRLNCTALTTAIPYTIQ